MQVKILHKVFKRHLNLQLIEELFLDSKELDKVDHFIIDFLLAHRINVINLLDCCIDVYMHSFYFTPSLRILDRIVINQAQELLKQMLLEVVKQF